MHRKGLKYFINNFDWVLLALVFISSALGIALIYSAGKAGGTSYRDVTVQSVAMMAGLIAMSVIMLVDYDVYNILGWFIGGIGLVLLVIVLIIGTGSQEVGTKGWIYLGSISIQPSEIAKVAFIISMSTHLAKIDDKINEPKNIALLILHFAAFGSLVMLQPDFGTTMVFGLIFLGMLFAAGLKLKYFGIAAATGVLAAVPVWFFVLSNFQRARFLTFLNPELAPLDEGYQVLQSKMAIGSGRLTGNGYMAGNLTQMGYLPQARTDFVYAVAGEELGFVGCVIILIVLLLIIWKCFNNAKNATDKFGSMICVGVGFFFLFHVVENVGMCMGLFPVTGIPLPFFSSGGSNMVASFMSLGLVLNVRMRRKAYGPWPY
ncbi:MAG: rod shape-determining protein RodA [Bacillota bacterium]|nr:rod shape-determining protein RodA [Bacillota bacterium]